MIDALIIAFLIVFNGLLALSELAVVSARRPRLRMLADAGRPGARRALRLADDPGRFLSTVQIGITLIGIVAGAYSGTTYGEALSERLQSLGISRQVSGPLGFGAVVAVITYLSLVVGELVPKQLALRHAETVACLIAPPMAWLSWLASPLVTLLDASTKAVLRLLGTSAGREADVTEEEIRMLIAEAESIGVLEAGEGRMMVSVLRLNDRPVRGIMTPRAEVEWIDATAGAEEMRGVLLRTGHSLLPVGDGSIDVTVGVVEARTLLAALVLGTPLDVRAHLKAAPVIPDTMDALDVIGRIRDTNVRMALVHDEYGNFEGVVTPTDILDALSGFAPGEPSTEPKAVHREDGSWLLSGWMPADEMADALGLVLPPQRDYQTVAGFVLLQLQHIPAVGEACFAQGWKFEVVDLDGRRIDKVLAVRNARPGRRAAPQEPLGDPT